MNSIKELKAKAEEYGYELWWDASLKLWTLTKENHETSHFGSVAIKNMPMKMFIKHYLENKEMACQNSF